MRKRAIINHVVLETGKLHVTVPRFPFSRGGPPDQHHRHTFGGLNMYARASWECRRRSTGRSTLKVF